MAHASQKKLKILVLGKVTKTGLRVTSTNSL